MKVEEGIALAAVGIAALIILSMLMNRGKPAQGAPAGPSAPSTPQAPNSICPWT